MASVHTVLCDQHWTNTFCLLNYKAIVRSNQIVFLLICSPHEMCFYNENKYNKKKFMFIEMFLNDLQLYNLMMYKHTLYMDFYSMCNRPLTYDRSEAKCSFSFFPPSFLCLSLFFALSTLESMIYCFIISLSWLHFKIKSEIPYDPWM